MNENLDGETEAPRLVRYSWIPKSLKRTFNSLVDERGLKYLLKEFFICRRRGHDWQDAGDWFICGTCDRLQKLPNPN